MSNAAINHPASQELARLRDIHLPDPVSWWPLARGVYFSIDNYHRFYYYSFFHHSLLCNDAS